MRKHFLLLSCILLITCVAFGPSLENQFVNWDDTHYILGNTHIRTLTFTTIKNSFSGFIVGNYHPMTMLSLAVDYKMAQLNPYIYHLTNLILHVSNVGLVFGFIFLLSRNVYVAAMTALLFGIHPMRVESVAWATERKDVLFAFFYFLSLISYWKFIQNALKRKWLWLCLLSFIASLLSKQAAITLPMILIVLDVYARRKINAKCLFEKIPFFCLSILFGLIAIASARIPTANAAPPPPDFSFFERIFLIPYALLFYLKKLFMPIGLTTLYPFPESTASILTAPYWIFVITFVFCFVYVFYHFRSQRVLFFGLCFFLLTISVNLPFFNNLGFTPVADRFSYVPYMGLFFIISYAIYSFFYVLGSRPLKTAIRIVVLAICLMCIILTRHQSKVWFNGLTLWTQVIKHYPDTPVAYYNRAMVLTDYGAYELALIDFTQAIKLFPRFYSAYSERGNLYFVMNRPDLAFNDYKKSIEINPRYTVGRLNLAAYYTYMKNYPEAIRIYDEILLLKPSQSQARQRKEKLLRQLK